MTDIYTTARGRWRQIGRQNEREEQWEGQRGRQREGEKGRLRESGTEGRVRKTENPRG